MGVDAKAVTAVILILRPPSGRRRFVDARDRSDLFGLARKQAEKRVDASGRARSPHPQLAIGQPVNKSIRSPGLTPG